MKNTEIQITEQPELLEVVKSSKIELSKAQSYAVGYAPFMQQVNELSLAIKELNKDNPTTQDAKIARTKRLELVKVRKLAETKKSDDKELILIEGRLIDGLFKVVENTSKLTENDYLEIEKHQERIEADKKAKLKIERIEKLEQFDVDISFIAIEDMSVEQFNIFFDSQKTAYEAKKEAERLAEVARIEAEKKSEEERIAKEKADKEERLRIEAENAKLKADQERIAKEQAIKDAAAKKEADRIAKIQAVEKAKQDAEIAKIKAEKEAAEKVIADQKAKEQAEAKRIEDAKKSAELAPDKEKIRVLFDSIKAISIPEFKTSEAKEIGVMVEKDLKQLLSNIINLSKGLS